MAAIPEHVLRRLDGLKQERAPRDGEFQQIADYFMPRKDFTVTPVPGQLRARRVASSVPQTALKRCAALLGGYMVDTSRPFIKPNVERGLVSAGKSVDLSAQSRDYLETVEWQLFYRMMSPRGGFLAGLARASIELVGFGSAVMWTGNKRGFGPRYQARPLRANWFCENDEGEIDTDYYCFSLPAWRVIERYPEAGKIEKIAKLAADAKTCQTPVELVQAVEPRHGGLYGSRADNKPFADVVVAVEAKAVIWESGYDSFPYQIPRLNVEGGSAYGTGFAWDALPDAMVLSRLQSAVERGVELAVEPPTFSPKRMFGRPLDRRAGASNHYDQAGLGFQSAKDAFQTIPMNGDPMVGAQYMDSLRQSIETAMFVDWMKLRDNGNVTAEEIRERRDLRLRALSAVVPYVDRDLMGRAGDRSLEIMVQQNLLPAPPAELDGLEVDWDYAGPLALAQRQGQADGFVRLTQLAGQVSGLDASATAVVAFEEGLRDCAEAWNVAAGAIRTRADVAETRARMAEQADEARSAETAAKGAAAFRDASQGAATLAAAGAQPDRLAA